VSIPGFGFLNEKEYGERDKHPGEYGPTNFTGP
jgi:hypothetical protein